MTALVHRALSLARSGRPAKQISNLSIPDSAVKWDATSGLGMPVSFLQRGPARSVYGPLSCKMVTAGRSSKMRVRYQSMTEATALFALCEREAAVGGRRAFFWLCRRKADINGPDIVGPT